MTRRGPRRRGRPGSRSRSRGEGPRGRPGGGCGRASTRGSPGPPRTPRRGRAPREGACWSCGIVLVLGLGGGRVRAGGVRDEKRIGEGRQAPIACMMQPHGSAGADFRGTWTSEPGLPVRTSPQAAERPHAPPLLAPPAHRRHRLRGRCAGLGRAARGRDARPLRRDPDRAADRGGAAARWPSTATRGEDVLVAWLSEVLYWFERDGFLPTAVHIDDARATRPRPACSPAGGSTPRRTRPIAW